MKIEIKGMLRQGLYESFCVFIKCKNNKQTGLNASFKNNR